MITRTCYLIPIGKPRMTRRDKWAKRPAVVKYRIFADALRQCMDGVDLTNVTILGIVAYLPFPKSYGAKVRASASGKLHRQKPDADNIAKAVMDALLEDDKGVAILTIKKYWQDENGARLEITVE
jgi:Holliday junction resolvase RusA-like endonuclease